MNTIRMTNGLLRGLLTLLLAIGVLHTASAQETVEYIHTDALGSPVAVTNADGSIIEKRAYEPYGASIGASIDGVGYTGHITDGTTGLLYMQQRYMDPTVGAFLSVDPISVQSDPIESFHRYRYGNENPYGFIDPDGREACGRDTGCRLDNGERGGSIGTPRTALTQRGEPRIMPAGSLGELIRDTGERVIRRTSFSANGGAAAGIGFDGVATKTTRPWQRDRLGLYKVLGFGAFAGANANFRIFSWGDSQGTTDLALKGNPLGYAKLRLGAGLSAGLGVRFNDHGGGTLSVSAGGGIGAQAVVKPPAMGGWEKEL